MSRSVWSVAAATSVSATRSRLRISDIRSSGSISTRPVSSASIGVTARSTRPGFRRCFAAISMRAASASQRITPTAYPGSAIVFLCTGTPSLSDGEADLRQVRPPRRRSARTCNRNLDDHRQQEHHAGRHRGARRRHRGRARPPGADVRGRQQSRVPARGQVLHDILHPDRVVLGGDDADALAGRRALRAAGSADPAHRSPLGGADQVRGQRVSWRRRSRSSTTSLGSVSDWVQT